MPAPWAGASAADPFDVELHAVSCRFDEVAAVEDVSLAIGKGEFFSLLGPSGCGKTTTLRMIGGFEEPTAGDIVLQGRRINGVPPHRRATNMVFQQLALFPHLSVFDNVAFGLRLKRLAWDEVRRRVAETLALVSLSGFEARSIPQLSGGQQQRVAIARALVNEPAVLLLDEPLGALDLKLRTQMQAELKTLQQRLGTTFVFVTHDQGEAFAMSDRVALMNGGRLEQVGPPRELYEQPASRFVATFVGETNLLEGRVVERRGGRVRIEASGLAFEAPAGELAAGTAVGVSLRPEHVDIRPVAAAGGTSATVRQVVYQGALVRLAVEVAGGRILQVQAVNGSAAAGLEPGTPVTLGWAPERVVVLPS